MDAQTLSEACELLWSAIRSGAGEFDQIFDPEFRLQGFPGPDPGARFARLGLEEAPSGEPAPDTPVPAPEAGIHYLHRFFGQGRGLVNLVQHVDGVQPFDEFGTVQMRWLAEHGLGEQGSPRYVSGRVALTFRRDPDGNWKLLGWLGSRGPHHAVPGTKRAEDVAAIREQILRVFEAYRQKELGVLRRTHTADWRGFSLRSSTVGRGIDAYMRAAEAAIASTQFEEYQILDLDAIFYGDMAVVPYVARIAGKNRQGRMEAYRLRVLDVYLREPTGWNQVATNTSLHPEEMIGG
jgi:ketosteroid isomerase-like protein